jgi:uncharacterized membrane protein (DUF106 family)
MVECRGEGKLGELPSRIKELQDQIRELTAKLEAKHAEKIEYQHEALKEFRRDSAVAAAHPRSAYRETE